MKKSIAFKIFSCIALIGAIASCKKADLINNKTNSKETENQQVSQTGNTQQADGVQTPGLDLYFCGFNSPGGIGSIACYWKNNEYHPVTSEGLPNIAYDIGVTDGHVYLIGRQNNQPCYWKDAGTHLKLSNTDYNGWPYSITSDAGVSYVVGRIQANSLTPFYPVLWIIDKDGGINEIFLEENELYTATGAYKVIKKDDDIYVSGSYQNHPCLWVYNNGQISRKDYEKNAGSIYDMVVYSGQLYLFGYYDIAANGNYIYGYWLNEEFHPLNLSSSMNNNKPLKHAITSNGEIYSVGETSNDPSLNTWAAFWSGVNSFGQQLSGNYSKATDIELDEQDIYVSGYDLGEACYWKSGTKVPLQDNLSQVRAMLLVNK